MNPFPNPTVLALGLIGAAAAAAIALSPRSLAQPQPQRAGPAPTKPLVSWSGAYSHVEKGLEITRITDPETWKQTWERHRGETIEKNTRGWSVVPDVDFTRCMVLAIFRGKSANNDGEYVVSIEERAADLLIRFDSASFQTASFDGGPDPGDKVTPYGLFVLPRSSRPIVVEENVQSLIDAEPKWKEKARFPALDAKATR